MKQILAKSTGLTLRHEHLSVHNATYLENIGLRYLNRYSQENIKDKLKHYFKFVIVRNPMERILSAFRDKFEKQNDFAKHFQRKYGRRIIREFRMNATAKSLQYGNDVKFSEFIKYLIYLAETKSHFNPHWRPYTQLCYPCHIGYDYIAKFETLQQDLRYFLATFGNDLCKQNESHLSSKASTTTDVCKQYFKSVPYSDLQKVKLIYTNDRLVFGY